MRWLWLFAIFPASGLVLLIAWVLMDPVHRARLGLRTRCQRCKKTHLARFRWEFHGVGEGRDGMHPVEDGGTYMKCEHCGFVLDLNPSENQGFRGVYSERKDFPR